MVGPAQPVRTTARSAAAAAVVRRSSATATPKHPVRKHCEHVTELAPRGEDDESLVHRPVLARGLTALTPRFLPPLATNDPHPHLSRSSPVTHGCGPRRSRVC